MTLLLFQLMAWK